MTAITLFYVEQSFLDSAGRFRVQYHFRMAVSDHMSNQASDNMELTTGCSIVNHVHSQTHNAHQGEDPQKKKM